MNKKMEWYHRQQTTKKPSATPKHPRTTPEQPSTTPDQCARKPVYYPPGSKLDL